MGNAAEGRAGADGDHGQGIRGRVLQRLEIGLAGIGGIDTAGARGNRAIQRGTAGRGPATGL